MKATTLILLFLVIFGLTAMLCAGRVGGQGERCLCRGKIQKRVRLQNVQKIEKFYPSPSCSKTEIVISLKRGKTVCLDPDARQGKNILNGKKRMKPKSQGGGKNKKKNRQ
ncbi:C-X-C motif chemokine 11-like [Colossoma macropomum]|uniref:C-X-C motif chemokine 11-like n=1 Tax=Colossoma macropomum TaxID=42526 RepID=UPI001863A90F|nr:C-X-C motif chemokine 11-like [Colossoma macropomum]